MSEIDQRTWADKHYGTSEGMRRHLLGIAVRQPLPRPYS